MKASLCTFALLCLPVVGAQYGGGVGSRDTTSTTASTTESSATTTASASSATQSVDVGEDGLTFNPDTIHVAAGGVVEFHFYPGDHSVAQAAFNNPCHPKSNTSFFSGFFPSAIDGRPVWTLTVNDTTPIWFYCGQVGHCQAGMVGVINPSGSDTLDAFKSAASSASGQSVPSTAQGGVLGTASTSQTATTSGSETTTSGSETTTSGSQATTGSMTTSSSTSGSSGTQTTSSGGSSPSATNVAANLRVSTDLSVLSILALTMAMLLM